MTDTQSTVLHIRIPAHVRRWLDIRAAAEDRTRAGMVVAMLKGLERAEAGATPLGAYLEKGKANG
jgi:hypothetical protein